MTSFIQQGPKLVGSSAVGPAEQGLSVALSADGNIAIIGGWFDNSGDGAAWVFTRSQGIWTQGNKLFGMGAVNGSVGVKQGSSVALSGDGNTALIGGPGDAVFTGAAWVFTRSSGIWNQQGPKLVGIGSAGKAEQGQSVALSSDGNTAILGGLQDNGFTGAAWVFTRSNGIWTQQGPKLVGTGAVGNAEQGRSVALSGDGNTAILGGPSDGGPGQPTGAAWVFVRSNGAWTQLGPKLVGSGAVGGALQGISVALSGDGNTAMLGGHRDNSDAGTAWVFFKCGWWWWCILIEAFSAASAYVRTRISPSSPPP
jgi:hypothetical protein